PPSTVDFLRREPARLDGDGVVAILGLHRLSAIEEALRSAPPDAAANYVVVTREPTEQGPLARLVDADFRACFEQAFPRSAWPRLQLVQDESVAAAAGVPAVSDATETAVRVESGRIDADRGLGR